MAKVPDMVYAKLYRKDMLKQGTAVLVRDVLVRPSHAHHDATMAVHNYRHESVTMYRLYQGEWYDKGEAISFMHEPRELKTCWLD